MLNTVETTDIFRSAFFLCKGGRLAGVRIKQDNRRIVAFLIEGEEIDRLDIDYRKGQALVNPLLLRETLNHLRDIIFTRLKNNEGRTRDDRERNHRGDQEEH